jgi:hypothetical protein
LYFALGFCAGAAFTAAMLRPRGRSHPLRGYVLPPASFSANPAGNGGFAITRTAAVSSSSTLLGARLEEDRARRMHPPRSNAGAPISSGEGTATLGGSGQPPPRAAYADSWNRPPGLAHLEYLRRLATQQNGDDAA